MPTPNDELDEHTGPPPSKRRALLETLDFVKAMRTSPAITAEEAMEWAELEQEFTNRTLKNEKST